jgi:heme oxygenase (biliverdin-IX-beta and delta-forming)
MAASPRRQMLRRGTSQVHSALDAMIGAFSSLSAYESYVRGTAGFRLPVERTIEHNAPIEQLAGWKPGLIGDDIRADLSALGLHDETDGTIAPCPQKIEDWLGMFYVLEGSSLGAKILFKRAEAINLNHTNGAAHLATQAGNSSNWNAFLTVLEDMPDLDEDRMIHWANVTFSFAHKAFENIMDTTLADH